MRIIITIFCFLPFILLGQNAIQSIIDQEYEKGHFNGSVLYIDYEHDLRINKGYSNFQFDVEIDDNTRFPIASITKLFTSLAVIHLHEKGLININDRIGLYLESIPEDCHNITIRDLLIHQSGLGNEPIKAVLNKYSIDEYISKFVRKSSEETVKYNYNNVDFILLSKIVEVVNQKDFSKSIHEIILEPLNLLNTGFVDEKKIIKNLAYGYHNYSFGEGEKNEPLYNDTRYLSNYYGAGAMYSSTQDLFKLLIAINENKIISKEAKFDLLLKPQLDDFIVWLDGKPTYGFYFNEQNNTYHRTGSIDGFNSQIIADKNFSKILIILCNTDTADLLSLANKIYFQNNEQ